MKIIAAIEVIFWMLLLYAVLRQIVVPLWNGERLFPMLRKRRDLEVRLRDARTELADHELAEQVKAMKAELFPAPPKEAKPCAVKPTIKHKTKSK